jgi:hypothetical protein
MKACRNCNCINLEDAKFCEKCGHQLAPDPINRWRIVIITVVAILLIGGVVTFFLLRDTPDPPDKICENFDSPVLTGIVQKSALVVFNNGKNDIDGNVKVYRINKDLNNNWELFENSPELAYQGETTDNTVAIFIRTYAEDYPNVVYVCKTDDFERSKKFLEQKNHLRGGLSYVQLNKLKQWNTNYNELYLTIATIPANYQDSSCVVIVYDNQIKFCWLNSDKKSINSTNITNIGYKNDTDIEANKGYFERAIRGIPLEKRKYFFTLGYSFAGIDFDRFVQENFIPVSDLLQESFINGNKEILRIFDIYNAIQAASGACIFYRKDICPEIGYLLYNNDQ